MQKKKTEQKNLLIVLLKYVVNEEDCINGYIMIYEIFAHQICCGDSYVQDEYLYCTYWKTYPKVHAGLPNNTQANLFVKIVVP